LSFALPLWITGRAARIAFSAGAVSIAAGLLLGGRQPIAVGLIPAPWDKLAHATVFALLTLCLWIGSGSRSALGAALGAAAIGVLDELQQSALPGRQAGFDDLAVDVAAAGATAVIIFVALRRRTASPNLPDI
jgi:hypothetical protein